MFPTARLVSLDADEGDEKEKKKKKKDEGDDQAKLPADEAPNEVWRIPLRANLLLAGVPEALHETAMQELLDRSRSELRRIMKSPKNLLGFAQAAAGGTLLPPPRPLNWAAAGDLLQDNWLRSWREPLEKRLRAAGVRQYLALVARKLMGELTTDGGEQFVQPPQPTPL